MAVRRTLPPFLRRIRIREPVTPDQPYPRSLPFLSDLDLTFDRRVTFFVGENGSGKSSLLEAIADMCRLPITGGGRNEVSQARSPLAPLLDGAFAQRPRTGYFFRAQSQAHFADLLDARKADPDFLGDPYARYGGRSLNHRSHGEAFLQMMSSWMAPGMILMDEPESALSAQSQLGLMVRIAQLAKRSDVQMIIATHSPMLLTFPDAAIVSFDGPSLAHVGFESTSHYQITRGVLEAPARYWQQLESDDEQE